MTENEAWSEFNFRCDTHGCLIVEMTAAGVVIRDSKDPALPGLVFSKREYADFRRRVRGDTWSRLALLSVTSRLRLPWIGRRRAVS
jgi:hypothetical protein